MSEQICDAADRVRRFLDARDGHFPIDVLAVVTRTGDRLLASDLRALVEEVDPDPVVATFEGFLVDIRDKAWADGYNHAKVEILSENQTEGDRLEAVIAWAEDHFGDSTLFPSGLAFALWTDPRAPSPPRPTPRRRTMDEQTPERAKVAPVLVSKPLAHIVAFWRPGSHDWTWADEYADLIDDPVTERIRDRVKTEGIAFVDHFAPVLLGSDGRVWDGHHRICLALQYHIHSLMVELATPPATHEPDAAVRVRETQHQEETP